MIHLMVWAFKTTFKCLGYIFAGGFILVALFLLLCMNVFTLPIYLICLLFSKLLKTNTPHVNSMGRCYILLGAISRDVNFGETLKM